MENVVMRAIADFLPGEFRGKRLDGTDRHRLLGAVFLPLLLSGCALPLPGSQPSKTPQTYYLQDEAGNQSAPAADVRSCLTLRIGSPGSAPGFTSEGMAYVKQAERMDYFAYHKWIDTPARMLGVLMEKRLESSGLLGEVLSGSPEFRARLRLDSKVIRLQQDFTGTGSAIKLDIKVNLMDSQNRSLLDSRTFSYTEPAKAENPEAGVAAANQAVQQFLSDLVVFVAQSIAPIDCDQAGS